MLTKLIILFLTIGQILAISYVENGKRPELFEIMDTEVPSFRVTMTDEQFASLKMAMQSKKLNMSEVYDKMGGGSDEIYDVVEFEKVKDASMVVEINDEEKEFSKVSFDIGGSSARTYGRQGFNLRIRDKKKDLYGRTQFRLRSDPRDATYLRSKICCDILNRMDIVSVSAGYVKLYVNDEYFGFYVIMDAPKLPWIEQVFGEKNSKNLYKCKSGGQFLTLQMNSDLCENEDEEATDRTEWHNLLTALDNAQSVEEIEDIFDVDQFVYLAVFDYLVGAWDHYFHSGHNYSMYKNKKTGKWMMIYYDFDSDLGEAIMGFEFANPFPNPDKNFPHYTVQDWFNLPFHMIQIGILNNLPSFETKLAKVVNNVFNPTLLFPHIDEVKDFIRPYVLYDKTPGKNGIKPGMLNLENDADYSMEQWDANSEFTTIHEPTLSDAYGIKYWILERYREVCNHYNLECDPVYMDENYEYPIDKEVEGEIDTHIWDGYDWSMYLGNGSQPEEQVVEPTEVPTEEPTEEPVEEPTEEPIVEPTEEPVEEPTEEPVVEPTEEPAEEPTEEPVVEPTEEPAEEPTEKPVEEPTEEPVEEPTEEPTEEPVVEPVVEPAEEPTEEPAEEPTEEPAEEPTEEPVVEPTEKPVEEPTEKPVEEPTEGSSEEPTEGSSEEQSVVQLLQSILDYLYKLLNGLL